MQSFWKLFSYGFAGWLPGGRKRCVICGGHVWRFMPYRQGGRCVFPLARALDMVGSDVDHFECPRCGAHDRERHLLMYLQASGLFAELSKCSILHFAPEKRLSLRIAQEKPVLHVLCDLYPTSDEVRRVDMQAMPFDSDTFDFLLANHVLEHVEMLDVALAEIHRVLKIGGYAILQTPFSMKLQHTWEDAGIDSAHARLQAFGQEDHVRLFGRDIFERITQVGFESLVKSHHELLVNHDAAAAGVNSREPFFLFRKI